MDLRLKLYQLPSQHFYCALFRIWKVLYACRQHVNPMQTYEDQIAIVRGACGHKEECQVECNSEIFPAKGQCIGKNIKYKD